MENKELYSIWRALNSYNNSLIVEECFFAVYEHYSSTDRYYHTLEHILDLMYQIRDTELLKVEERQLLSYTAFFHDIVYNATRKDNELKSALLAKSWLLKLEVSENTTKQVVQLIENTKYHNDSSDYISNLFNDMDLSILGAVSKKYKEYSNKIRLEYSYLPNSMYRIGRKQFLNKLLSRPKIFVTDSYYSQYEITARRNLRTELNTL